MRFRTLAAVSLTAAGVAFAGSCAWCAPSVYPTGTTLYDPAQTWSGYTVLSPLGTQAVLVIDMNGRKISICRYVPNAIASAIAAMNRARQSG